MTASARHLVGGGWLPFINTTLFPWSCMEMRAWDVCLRTARRVVRRLPVPLYNITLSCCLLPTFSFSAAQTRKVFSFSRQRLSAACLSCWRAPPACHRHAASLPCPALHLSSALSRGLACCAPRVRWHMCACVLNFCKCCLFLPSSALFLPVLAQPASSFSTTRQ